MPFIPLIVLAALGALGAFAVRSASKPNFVNIAAPANGPVVDVAKHVSVLDERWSSPNQGERAAAPWYDFLAGDPADLGYTSEDTGPASIPGGELRDEKGPNYTTPSQWTSDAGKRAVRVNFTRPPFGAVPSPVTGTPATGDKGGKPPPPPISLPAPAGNVK